MPSLIPIQCDFRGSVCWLPKVCVLASPGLFGKPPHWLGKWPLSIHTWNFRKQTLRARTDHIYGRQPTLHNTRLLLGLPVSYLIEVTYSIRQRFFPGTAPSTLVTHHNREIPEKRLNKQGPTVKKSFTKPGLKSSRVHLTSIVSYKRYWITKNC